MKKSNTYLFCFVLLSCFYIGCKTEGCTYPNAVNYEDDAELDDGSCVFPENDGEGNEDNDDQNDSSAADNWIGNYIIEESQTSSFNPNFENEESYSISISETTSTEVMIQNFLGCSSLQANVTSNSMVIVNLDECMIFSAIITPTEDGFTYVGSKDDFGFALDVEGTAVRQ